MPAHCRIGLMKNKINKDKSIINECNILTDVLNPTKLNKSKYDYYSPILQSCMKSRSGTALFRNFQILLDSGISSTVIMSELASKIKPNVLTETTWETQAGKFMTSKKVEIYFYLPEFCVTKIVSWKFEVDRSTNSR